MRAGVLTIAIPVEFMPMNEHGHSRNVGCTGGFLRDIKSTRMMERGKRSGRSFRSRAAACPDAGPRQSARH